ncbi:hypothetical protein ES703_100309 [subsurface metagenome]
MKRYVLSMMLAAMLLPTGLFGQEQELEEAEFRMEMRERQMELEQREAEMDIERRMQELELEERELELERLRRKHHGKDGAHPLLLLVLVVHILVAVWVYQDIRRRGCGSGIWIVIALLTGLLGTLIYAVVRLGDSEKEKA